jgi:hypothetical protein
MASTAPADGGVGYAAVLTAAHAMRARPAVSRGVRLDTTEQVNGWREALEKERRMTTLRRSVSPQPRAPRRSALTPQPTRTVGTAATAPSAARVSSVARLAAPRAATPQPAKPATAATAAAPRAVVAPPPSAPAPAPAPAPAAAPAASKAASVVSAKPSGGGGESGATHRSSGKSSSHASSQHRSGGGGGGASQHSGGSRATRTEVSLRIQLLERELASQRQARLGVQQEVAKLRAVIQQKS